MITYTNNDCTTTGHIGAGWPEKTGRIGRDDCVLPKSPKDWNCPHKAPCLDVDGNPEPDCDFNTAVTSVRDLIADVNDKIAADPTGQSEAYKSVRLSYPKSIQDIYNTYLAATGRKLEYPVLLWDGTRIHAFILQEQEVEHVHPEGLTDGPVGRGQGKHSSSSMGM